MAQKGERVGAILSADEAGVRFLGWGVYEGDEVPTEEAKGLADMLREAKIPNPKIKLDNGKVVWGCECWWGSEAKVKEQIKDQTIIETDIDLVRKEENA